jgi:hypothetical protein
MSLMTRALLGGAAGGMLTGTLGGVAGGAAAGTLGWGTMNKFGAGLGASKYMRRGLGAASRGMAWGSRKLGNKAWDLTVGGAAAGYGRNALNSMRGGLVGARRFMGANAVATNRYAGMAMGALGTAAGAYIGSSVLRSNRGY